MRHILPFNTITTVYRPFPISSSITCHPLNDRRIISVMKCNLSSIENRIETLKPASHLIEAEMKSIWMNFSYSLFFQTRHKCEIIRFWKRTHFRIDRWDCRHECSLWDDNTTSSRKICSSQSRISKNWTAHLKLWESTQKFCPAVWSSLVISCSIKQVFRYNKVINIVLKWFLWRLNTENQIKNLTDRCRF